MGDSDSASDYAIRLLEDKVLYNKLQKNMLADMLNVLDQNSLQINMSIIIKMLNEHNKSKGGNNMDKSLFEQARPILEQIQDNGFEAYYVGGSVKMSWEEIFMI